jgi:hypothetical protein
VLNRRGRSRDSLPSIHGIAGTGTGTYRTRPLADSLEPVAPRHSFEISLPAMVGGQMITAESDLLYIKGCGHQ